MSGDVPVKVPYFDLICKFCGSRSLIKYGTYKARQRFLCRDCGRKSADSHLILSEFHKTAEAAI
jgi:hypothetical protein